jgi:hypothetical protein
MKFPSSLPAAAGSAPPISPSPKPRAANAPRAVPVIVAFPLFLCTSRHETVPNGFALAIVSNILVTVRFLVKAPIGLAR